MTGLRDATLPWPPESELERLRRYEQGRLLYNGDHERVFVSSNAFKFTYDRGREYVYANLCGALTDLLSSRLFGEECSVHAPDELPAVQEFFEHLESSNRMDALNMLAAVGASYRGDCFYKVWYDAASERVRIGLVDPASCVVTLDALDATRMWRCTIGQVLRDAEGLPYLWQEAHELRGSDGWVVNMLYRAREERGGDIRYDPDKDRVALTTLPQTASLPDEVATGVDALLVIHVPNKVADEGSFWGVSDYAGLLGVQGELNHRLTQRAEVQDKFVDPIMYGPDRGDEHGEIRLRGGTYITVGDGEAVPGALIWDPSMAAVEAELKELRELFAATAGIDMAALLPPDGGAPASGRAIRLSQMRTQTVVRAKQRMFGPALQQVFSVATKLATREGVVLRWQPTEGELVPVQPEDIAVYFNDGLPSDRTEDIADQAAMIEAGVQSKLAAIKELHGVDDESARAILAEIAGDAPALSNPLGAGSRFSTVLPTSGRAVTTAPTEPALGEGIAE